jgi:hypothetical protein
VFGEVGCADASEGVGILTTGLSYVKPERFCSALLADSVIAAKSEAIFYFIGEDFSGESGASVYLTSKADFSSYNARGFALFSSAIFALRSSIGFSFFFYLYTPLPFPGESSLPPPPLISLSAGLLATFFALFSIVLSTRKLRTSSILAFLSNSAYNLSVLEIITLRSSVNDTSIVWEILVVVTSVCSSPTTLKRSIFYFMMFISPVISEIDESCTYYSDLTVTYNPSIIT